MHGVEICFFMIFGKVLLGMEGGGHPKTNVKMTKSSYMYTRIKLINIHLVIERIHVHLAEMHQMPALECDPP